MLRLKKYGSLSSCALSSNPHFYILLLKEKRLNLFLKTIVLYLNFLPLDNIMQ